MRFADRKDAGRRLAAALARFKNADPVVLALPRGGVAIGREVADALKAPLDLVLVRKIGAPFQPEYAIGAIVDGEAPDRLIDEEVVKLLGVPQSYLEETIAEETREIERRRRLYLQGRSPEPVGGRTAIVVDDGIATGATMRIALRAVRRRQPGRLVMAVPVGAAATIAQMQGDADEVVCLDAPHDLGSVGQFYRDFSQLTDQDVIALLGQARPAG